MDRDGETRPPGGPASPGAAEVEAPPPTPGGGAPPGAADAGILVGLLVGEGHFGGDGRQPQVTLRMHVDHESLFRWLERAFSFGRLYGPYDHGGRRYFQWMVRGRDLREQLVPLLDAHLSPSLDQRTWRRYRAMCDRYGIPGAGAAGDAGGPLSGTAAPVSIRPRRG